MTARRPCFSLPQLSRGASDSTSVIPSLKWDNNSSSQTVGVLKVHQLIRDGCWVVGTLGGQGNLAARIHPNQVVVLSLDEINHPAPRTSSHHPRHYPEKTKTAVDLGIITESQAASKQGLNKTQGDTQQVKMPATSVVEGENRVQQAVL